MFRTYKYRLFTTANQERELSVCLETHRRLYNEALDGMKLCWETAGVHWGFYEQSAWFTKRRKLNDFYSRLNSSSARQTLRNLEKTYKKFFSDLKAGRKNSGPRFKSAGRFNSFSYRLSEKGGGWKIVNGKLRLQNIGTIRVRWHRELPDGEIKQAQIVREGSRWFVCFLVEVKDPSPTANAKHVGIDVGLNAFVTTSGGEVLGDSKIMSRHQKELGRMSRKLSRAKPGSSTRKKTKKRVTTLHAKVRNSRRDMHHKVARYLVDRYGVIAAESLNVKGMVKNSRLARSISDAGWGQFLGILSYKAEIAGGRFIQVNPKNTSQECSQCGALVKKSLGVRIHSCDCGLVLDRDVNAALNILARALPGSANSGVT